MKDVQLIQGLCDLVAQMKCRVCIKSKVWTGGFNWSTWMDVPTVGYIETSSGPVAISEVDAVCVDPLVKIIRGRLVQPYFEDKSMELAEWLTENNFIFIILDNIFLIKIN
jgi:hypothetical protein